MNFQNLICICVLLVSLSGSYTYSQEINQFKHDACNFIPKSQEVADKRVSFVIGNSNYEANIGPLKNPQNDATDVAKVLSEIGFDTVLVLDASQQKLIDCFSQFKSMLENAEIALFYYAGHGIQIGDQNYVVPIDIKNVTNILGSLVPVEQFVEAMRFAANNTIILLDACRNNPFSEASSAGLSISTGLGKNSLNSITENLKNDSNGPSGQFLVSFSASPYSVAADGTGRNSPYTAALLKQLPVVGQSLQQSLVEVAYSVGKDTNWQQTPFTRSSMSSLLMLNGRPELKSVVAASKSFALDALNSLSAGKRNIAIATAIKGLPIGVDDAVLNKQFSSSLQSLEYAFFADIFTIDGAPNSYGFKISKNKSVAAGVKKDKLGKSKLNIWSIENGNLLSQVDLPHNFQIHWTYFAISNDGTTIAYPVNGNSDAVLDIVIFDIMKNKQISRLRSPLQNGSSQSTSPQIQNLEFNSTGKFLLITEGDVHALQVFDVQTGKVISALSPSMIESLNSNALHYPNSTKAQFLDDDRICFTTSVASGKKFTNFFGIFDYNSKEIETVRIGNQDLSIQLFECSAMGNYFAVNTYIRSPGIWKSKHIIFGKKRILWDTPFPSENVTFHFSKNEKYAVTVGELGPKWLDTQSGKILTDIDIASTLPKGYSAVFTTTGAKLFDIHQYKTLFFRPKLKPHNLIDKALIDLPSQLRAKTLKERLVFK